MKRYKLIAVLLAGASVLGFAENAARVVHYHPNDIVAIRAKMRYSLQFDSVNYWYWEHWKFFRHEVKTSIIQGIAVFLSLFEADPDVRRVFCPPKDLYEGKPVESDPDGRVLTLISYGAY
jgi:hypothetical protein